MSAASLYLPEFFPQEMVGVAPDTVVTQDTVVIPRREGSSVDARVDRIASDSIVQDLINRKVYLYGDAVVKYGDITLKAEIIEVLQAVQAPYALATPVVESVENAMQTESLAETDRLANEIAMARDNFIASVEPFRFVTKVWPSAANFFLIKVKSADALLAYVV